jgi:hypothetical protein
MFDDGQGAKMRASFGQGAHVRGVPQQLPLFLDAADELWAMDKITGSIDIQNQGMVTLGAPRRGTCWFKATCQTCP